MPTINGAPAVDLRFVVERLREVLRNRGISCKAIFDCTVPFSLKERFERAQFMEVDLQRFTNGGGVVR